MTKQPSPTQVLGCAAEKKNKTACRIAMFYSIAMILSLRWSLKERNYFFVEEIIGVSSTLKLKKQTQKTLYSKTEKRA